MDHRLIITLLFALALSSCSFLSQNNSRTPICKELNSRIIFSGATSNSRQAQIQNAQERQLIRGYDTQCDNNR